jgi:pimeloyl-ACP methyl ester carboxylesterase
MLIRRTFLLAAMASLAAACASAPEPRFTSDRIAVAVQGPRRPVGPDVILIPGLSSSPKAWASTVAAHPRRRFHLVQVKGFAGTSPGANAEGPVAAPVAEEVARYIEAMGLRKPAVVGHSMGGTIALMTAARHPERVGRVMVVDMVPFMGALFGPPGATPNSVRPVADQIRTAMRGPPSAAGEAQLKTMIDGMVRTEAMRPVALADSQASDRTTSANAFHELITTDLRPELARITAPTTVLYVRPPTAPVSAEQMDALYRTSFTGLEGVQLKRIPDSWHFIQWDAPERFNRELRAFLDARQGRPPPRSGAGAPPSARAPGAGPQGR